MGNDIIYSHCTSKSFKKDLNELCSKCPLVSLIKEKIQTQIISQAIDRKNLLSEEHFKKYLESEIQLHLKAMERDELVEAQNKSFKNDPYRTTRIKHYIWNKESIKALNQLLNDSTNSRKQKTLSLKEIALKYIYEGLPINPENCNEIVQNYGLKSGQKLNQHYNKYCMRIDRIANEPSEQKLKNKIDLFAKVANIVDSQFKKKIEDEIEILRKYLANQNF